MSNDIIKMILEIETCHNNGMMLVFPLEGIEGLY